MMMELKARFSMDAALHNWCADVFGPKILVICEIKTITIDISAADKLTSIVLDAVRRFGNCKKLSSREHCQK